MAVLFLSKAQTIFNSAGLPRVGGKVNFYISGTTTRLDTFSDDSLSTANLNPLTLDSAGRPGTNVFFSAADYKVVFTNSDLSDSITVDPLHGGDALEAATLVAAKALYPASLTLSNGSTLYVKDRATAGDGYGGQFYYDSTDASSTFTRDALGFVDNASRRWKRIYTHPIVNPRWYQLKLDLTTDDTLPLNDLLADMSTLKIEPFFELTGGATGLNCKKFDLTNIFSVTLRFTDGFPIHGMNTIASDFVFGVGTGYASANMAQRIVMYGQPKIYADAGTAYQNLVRFYGCTNSILRFVAQDGPVIAALVDVDLFFWNDVYLSFGTGSSIPLALPYGLICNNNNVNANNFYGGTCAGRTSATGVGLYLQGAGNNFAMGDLSGWDYGVELSVSSGCRLHCYFESNITGAIKIRNSTAALVKGLTVTGFATGAVTAVNLIASTPANTPLMQDLDFSGFLVKSYTNGFKLYGSQITNITIPQPGATVTNHVVWQDGTRPRNVPLAMAQLVSVLKADLPTPSAGLAGCTVYVTDDAAGATIAFCNGSAWKRPSALSTVS